MKTIPSFLALASLAATSHAAVIYSGLRDIGIPANLVGIYLDVDAQTTVPEDGAGWDLNPFFGGEGLASSPSFRPVALTLDLDAAAENLNFGEIVGALRTFATPYPGGFSGSATHVGNGPGQFLSDTEGYIGFELRTNANAGPYFGWMRLQLSNTGAAGLIRDWAYDTTGGAITVGAVPEPAAATLSFVCAMSMMALRRRRRLRGE